MADKAKTTAKAAEAPETAKAAEVKQPSPRDMVELYAAPPATTDEEPNIVIYVNGSNWVIPKDGGTHTVPRYVADEYHLSQKARTKALRNKANRAAREAQINARTAAQIGGSVV